VVIRHFHQCRCENGRPRAQEQADRTRKIQILRRDKNPKFSAGLKGISWDEMMPFRDENQIRRQKLVDGLV
jgi:hypothetical protein